MSAVDVLAVLDAVPDWLILATVHPENENLRGSALKVREARAAVAELIAADLEYDEASAAYDNQWTLIDAAGLGARVTAAIERRRTALANIGADQ